MHRTADGQLDHDELGCIIIMDDPTPTVATSAEEITQMSQIRNQAFTERPPTNSCWYSTTSVPASTSTGTALPVVLVLVPAAVLGF
jgi:hypothetical protein